MELGMPAVPGRFPFLFLVICFCILGNFQSYAASNYEIEWHPKFRMQDNSEIASIDNPYHVSTHWRVSEATNSRMQWPAPAGSLWPPLVFVVRKKDDGKLLDHYYTPKYYQPFTNEGHQVIQMLPNTPPTFNNVSNVYLWPTYGWCWDGTIYGGLEKMYVSQGHQKGYVREPYFSQKKNSQQKCRFGNDLNNLTFSGQVDNVLEREPRSSYEQRPVHGIQVIRGIAFNQDPGERRLHIKYIDDPVEKPDVFAEAYTPMFNVTSARHIVTDLKVVTPHPLTVTANHPFKIKFKQINEFNETVSTGYGSKNYVKAEVHSAQKLWYKDLPWEALWLYSIENVISGPDAFKDKATNQMIAYKQMTGGEVEVTIALEDVSAMTTLNFTLMRRGSPWTKERSYHPAPFGGDTNITNYYTATGTWGNVDLYAYQDVDIDGSTYMRVNKPRDVYGWRNSYLGNRFIQLPGIIYTNVTVIAQDGQTLRFTTNTPNAMQRANVEITGITVELVDSSDYRVTSGPDSSLTITVGTVGGGTISNDASFNLVRGVGTFKGSVIDAASDIQLKFSATTTKAVDADCTTGKISVTTKIHITEFSETANEKRWKRMAIDDIKNGRLNYLKGRSISMDSMSYNANIYAMADLMTYLFDTSKSLAVSSGGSLELVKSLCNGIAVLNNAPCVNHNLDNSGMSDNNKYQYMPRMKFSSAYYYRAVGSFLKNRYWDNVVLLVDGTKEVGDLKMQLSIQDITIMQIKVTNLPDTVKEIKDTKSKVIIPMLSGKGLSDMVTHAAANTLTPLDGYQWIGLEDFAANFPHDDAVSNTKFKGTIVMQTDYYKTKDNTKWGNAETTLGNYFSEGTKTVGALAYDSVAIIAAAMDSIVKLKKTISLVSLATAIKSSTESGLTGPFKFSALGERTNFMLKVLQIDAGGSTGIDIFKLAKYAKYDENSVFKEEHEADLIYTGSIGDYKKNSIDILTNTGTKTEKVPPTSEFCGTEAEHGCGGEQKGRDNRYWDHGTCRGGMCICKTDLKTNKPGYTGTRCLTAKCTSNCLQPSADCTGPSTCKCNKGYKLNYFSNSTRKPTMLERYCIPNCDSLDECSGDAHGECIAPDTCTCDKNKYGSNCGGICKDCGEDDGTGKCSDGSKGIGECICNGGYMGGSCGFPIWVLVVIILVGGGLIMSLLTFAIRHHIRQAHLKAALYSMEWKAEWNDIRMRQKRNRSSVKSMVSMVSMMTSRMSRMSGKSGRDERVVCQNQGSWNGKEIVIKTLDKDSVGLTESIRKEIQQMKDINHMNLCQFIGAVIDKPNVAVLNEVCGKGSLEDVLFNDQVELDWGFKFSILKDIVRGMKYLHSTEIVSHGRLKSSNVLVDNRWCAKIADYGMKEFKSHQYGIRVFNPGMNIGVELPTEEELEGCDYYGLLWCAPEILSTGVSHPNHVGYGTQEGDVYSFGIIMSEICTSNHPFAELDHLGPEEIVPIVGGLVPLDADLDKVGFTINGGTEVVNSIRPKVEHDQLPEEKGPDFLHLMNQCWDHDPHNRPRFESMMKILNTISPHRGELMDNLIDLMTHYTNSLEMVISERTADLHAEKEASDALLMKMLPAAIAEELKGGNNPLPEYFNCVTIQFSDVVGFGKICNESTPIQVVGLLNALYGVMDDVIDTFDCYKVETIADSYVVASGIPVRNGDKHASEIATMALHLLARINDVSYDHLPGSQVQLRMGINSGPIVGGVVGLRMPRYCLFGDTMNTASRMESGGYALKIHISEATFKLLEEAGGFQTICRGEREIKGKGTMTTYWLTGKDGLDLIYPSEDKAATQSEHDFK